MEKVERGDPFESTEKEKLKKAEEIADKTKEIEKLEKRINDIKKSKRKQERLPTKNSTQVITAAQVNSISNDSPESLFEAEYNDAVNDSIAKRTHDKSEKLRAVMLEVQQKEKDIKILVDKVEKLFYG